MLKNKINVIFICPYPLGQSPSQRFRFEQYFDLMRKSGFSIKVCPFLSLHVWEVLYRNGNSVRKILGVLNGFIGRFKLLFIVSKFDFVFIHREATPVGPPWFEWAVANLFHKKIVYDFDDAIWLRNTSKENKIVSRLKCEKKVYDLCRWSYAVSCGNEYLLAFARPLNHHTILNPTTIDTEKLHDPDLYPQKKKSDQFTIGWTGTHSTLKYIDSVIPAIQRLEKKFPNQFQFVVIADKKPSVMLTSMCFVPWSKKTEIQDLLQFDVGLMPLTDDAWAKGKGGFKALQYMALKIPVLASPVGINTKIVEHGIDGYLCDTLEDWIHYLEKLLSDLTLRREMGKNGRNKIIEHYSVISNSANFICLFNEIKNNTVRES